MTNDRDMDRGDQPSDTETPSMNPTIEPTSATQPEGASSDDVSRVEALAREVASLSEQLSQHKAAFQGIEVSLVTRIADVDDDRRQAATRLQRTLQTHQEEIEERFKRQASLVAVTLILIVLVVGAALAFAHFRFNDIRHSLATQLDGVEQAVDEMDASAPPSAQSRGQDRAQLAALTSRVEEIAGRLDRLSQTAESAGASASQPATDREALEPRTGGEVDALSATVGSLSENLDRLVRRVDALQQSADAPESTPAAMDSGIRTQLDALATSIETVSHRLDSMNMEIERASAAAPSSSTPPAEPLQPVPEAQAAPSTPTSTLRDEAAAPDRMQTDRVDLAQTPFTVQLMGFYSRDSMKQFVRDQERMLPDTLYYQTTTYQGRPWYVLIHGVYATEEAAEAAAAKLPKDLAKLDIWIRQLDTGKDVRRLDKSSLAAQAPTD